MRPIGMRLPIVRQTERSIGADAGRVAAANAPYPFEKRRTIRLRTVQQEMLADLHFRPFARHAFERPQRLDLRRKGEERLALVIVDTTLAHVIAAQHQLFGAAVPQREGEIAEQMRGRVLAPRLVGAQDEGAVGHVADVGGGETERGGQFLPIVDPAIGDQGYAGVPVVERLRLEQILGVDPHQAMAEANRPVGHEFASVPARDEPAHCPCVPGSRGFAAAPSKRRMPNIALMPSHETRDFRKIRRNRIARDLPRPPRPARHAHRAACPCRARRRNA